MRHLTQDPHTRRCINDFTINGLRPGRLLSKSVPECPRLDGVLLLRFIEGHAGAIVARDLCTKLFKDFLENHPDYSTKHLRVPGSHSTKSTSPGGLEEQYANEPLSSSHHLQPPSYNEKLMEPDFGGKPKYV